MHAFVYKMSYRVTQKWRSVCLTIFFFKVVKNTSKIAKKIKKRHL